MPFRTRKRTVASDGAALAVVEAGDPARPTVLMIHGYPDTKEVWEPVMQRLAGAFHVAAYDVRGAGESTTPRGAAAYDLTRLAADFSAVRAAVSPQRPVHLVGHDWGGIQGWEFVTAPGLAGAIASFTSIAGPALGHALRAGGPSPGGGRPPVSGPGRAAGGPRRAASGARAVRALARLRRSWYIVPLCLPGGPQIVWRVVLTPGRWRWYLEREGVPIDGGYPRPTLTADGINGARLYRRNIPPRLVRPRPLAAPTAPVQLIVPERDRFISPAYYAAAHHVAPDLRRRTVPGSHWAIRTQPRLVADWISEFATAAEG